MQVCISKYILGTDKHLIFSKAEDLYSWSPEIPENAWFYGNAPDYDRSLNDLCLLFNVTPRVTPPEKYVRSFTEVGMPGGLSAPWHLVLPHDEFRKYISSLLGDLQRSLDDLNDTTYCEKFLSNRRVLTSLCDSHIDTDLLNHYTTSEANPTLLSTLKSFTPDQTGRLKKPVYQQGSTGRTTVKRGPKILTLKREHRAIIKSRYKGGKVVQLDYSSLEPRIMLAIAEKKVNGDIYDDIASKAKLNLDRAKLKMAVMGALYGISSLKLQGLLPNSIDAAEVLDQIRHAFGINSLANKLKKECAINGRIINHFGRPLYFSRCDDHLLVSHYIQSTGVDVCLSGFSKIIDFINQGKMKTVPIFLIHDALLLDMPADEIDKLDLLKAAGSSIDGFDVSFPLNASNVLGESFA
jgi:DNA polymerase I-like protein with 3'-5' exonuclease and polymerase domains